MVSQGPARAHLVRNLASHGEGLFLDGDRGAQSANPACRIEIGFCTGQALREVFAEASMQLFELNGGQRTAGVWFGFCGHKAIV